jgi:hypothetical protein
MLATADLEAHRRCQRPGKPSRMSLIHALSAAALCAVLLPVSAASSQDRGASTLRVALADYIDRFEREFSSAVAEERYVQLLRPLRDAPAWPSDERALEWHEGRADYPRTNAVLDRRQLLSDVLLVHTVQGWLGYRDVAAVDGRAVRNRAERISRLFLSEDADRADQLRRVAEESARHNIGPFRRTLNIPTLALSFLHRRNHSRFIFSSEGRNRIDGRDVDVLRYEEQATPTLLGTSAGRDVSMSGRIWLDADTGSVVQTEMRVMDERRGELVTRYREEPGFEVMVPDFMWEWYDAGNRVVVGSFFRPAIVECLARYVKYRRFSVSTDEKIGR